jgi:hypothetical protein
MELLHYLPCDIFYSIIEELPLIDLLALTQVNREFHRVLYEGDGRDIWLSRWRRDLSIDIPAGSYSTRRDEYIRGMMLTHQGLMVMATKGYEHQVSRLISGGIDTTIMCYRAYLLVIEHNHPEVLKVLYKLHRVMGLLAVAIKFNATEIISLLLELGYTLKEDGSGNNILIDSAIESGNPFVLEYVLQNIDGKLYHPTYSTNIWNGLHLCPNVYPILSLLSKYEVPIPFATIAYHGTIEVLMWISANIPLSVAKGKDILEFIIKGNHDGKIKIVLNHLSPVDLNPNYLLRVIDDGNIRTVRLLLQKGISIDEEAIYKARENNQIEMFRLLMEHQK